MKITSVSASNINFKSILYPQKYSEVLKECIDEIIPPIKEVATIQTKKNLKTEILDILKDLKSKLAVEQYEEHYIHRDSLFIKNSPQKTTSAKIPINPSDNNIWSHTIYKSRELDLPIIAKKEESDVFELFRKKISSMFYSDAVLSDETLLKKHYTALIDDDNVMMGLQTHSILTKQINK